MRIPRLYHPQHADTGARLDLGRTKSRYLTRVLRLRSGSHIRLFDGAGREVEGTITVTDRNAVTVDIGDLVVAIPESPLQITLAPAIPKGERMDYLLQKSVELGVHAIHPLVLERSDVRLTTERIARKMDHWRGIMASACEQCGRAQLPILCAPGTLTELINLQTGVDNLRVLFDVDASGSLQSLSQRPSHRMLIVTGPEGGFSPEERRQFEQARFTAVKLGPRTLRAETAAPAAIAAAQVLWGDLC